MFMFPPLGISALLRSHSADRGESFDHSLCMQAMPLG